MQPCYRLKLICIEFHSFMKLHIAIPYFETISLFLRNELLSAASLGKITQ